MKSGSMSLTKSFLRNCGIDEFKVGSLVRTKCVHTNRNDSEKTSKVVNKDMIGIIFDAGTHPLASHECFFVMFAAEKRFYPANVVDVYLDVIQ